MGMGLLIWAPHAHNRLQLPNMGTLAYYVFYALILKCKFKLAFLCSEYIDNGQLCTYTQEINV